MQIKFIKTHQNAELPKRNHSDGELYGTHDSGFDIIACEDVIIAAHNSGVVLTGIKVGYITPGYWFRIESRSGLSFKYSILAHPGIIDNGYTGDLGVKLYNHSDVSYQVHQGDRIAQLVVYPLIDVNVEWAEAVHETKRGEKGFGSSGS